MLSLSGDQIRWVPGEMQTDFSYLLISAMFKVLILVYLLKIFMDCSCGPRNVRVYLHFSFPEICR